MKRPILMAGLVAALALVGQTGWGAQQNAPTPCEEIEGFHKLDFWVGRWDVFSRELKVGTNSIEKILKGCALVEHWNSEGGGKGTSLFYYLPATDTWKQVWVTENAAGRGGVKEKVLIEELEGGAVRFQGRIALPDGGSYYDRTTLTPLAEGKVRQQIEVSQDGREWRTTFDAVYVPVGD